MASGQRGRLAGSAGGWQVQPLAGIEQQISHMKASGGPVVLLAGTSRKGRPCVVLIAPLYISRRPRAAKRESPGCAPPSILRGACSSRFHTHSDTLLQWVPGEVGAGLERALRQRGARQRIRSSCKRKRPCDITGSGLATAAAAALPQPRHRIWPMEVAGRGGSSQSTQLGVSKQSRSTAQTGRSDARCQQAVQVRSCHPEEADYDQDLRISSCRALVVGFLAGVPRKPRNHRGALRKPRRRSFARVTLCGIMACLGSLVQHVASRGGDSAVVGPGDILQRASARSPLANPPRRRPAPESRREKPCFPRA